MTKTSPSYSIQRGPNTFFLRKWCAHKNTPIVLWSFSTILVLSLVSFILVPTGIFGTELLVNMAFKGTSENCDVANQEENNCNIQIVESIPDGLNFSKNSPHFMSTYEAWSILLDSSKDFINIGSFYWTLLGSDVVNHSTAQQGEEIFQRIISNGLNRRIKIKIAQNVPNPSEPNLDTEMLMENGAADVRSLNFSRLLGNGILHTKMWIVDNKHFYLGSANMDWRALTQVKELGILAQNCSSLASDLAKIFDVYWYLGQNTSTVPDRWPKKYSTKYNWNSPMLLNLNERIAMSGFFSSSPPPLSSDGRTNDLDAILSTIANAKSFVNIAVMDYLPLMLYTERIRYWPLIDDALRTAAVERNISIKMLISWWPHSDAFEDNFLQSLSSLSFPLQGVSVEIRRFIVPSNEDQSKIPFSRVNHNKYMVTDNTAYISTSNWSGDYFTHTAGVALVLRDVGDSANKTTIRAELLAVFQRDWESPYAVELSNGKYDH